MNRTSPSSAISVKRNLWIRAWSAISSITTTVRGIGTWLDELRKAVSRQQIIESPDDYPLSEVISAYLDMRKDGRETWSRYAQEKGAVHDLKDGFKAVSFLSNHELYTVGQLGRYIDETKQTFSKIKAESAAKERRIRDINALFGAIQTIRALKPIQQKYESIHFISWRFKKNPFLSHLDSLPQTPYNKRENLYRAGCLKPFK